MNKKLEQIEMFDTISDNRIRDLRAFIGLQLKVTPFWHPSVKDLEKMSEYYKVVEGRILSIYEEITKNKDVDNY